MSDDSAVHLFNVWGRLVCSACAPKELNEQEVEQAVFDLSGTRFVCVDRSKIIPGFSSPTHCQHSPRRWHWFLLRDDIASKFAETKH